MKYVVIIFFIISCSDTPIEAPIDSYRDIKINIDMSSAIENGLFNKNNDTLKLQLDKSTFFQMQNEDNSNKFSCNISNLIMGKTYQYQYIINEKVEILNHMRSFTIIDSENMILDYYGEINPTIVTFIINMSYQVELGNFVVENDYVDVAGTFNDWDGSNDHLFLVGNDIYTLSITNIQIGDVIEFKFRINGSWDTAEFPGDGPNRNYTILQGNNILEYWFSDQGDD